MPNVSADLLRADAVNAAIARDGDARRAALLPESAANRWQLALIFAMGVAIAGAVGYLLVSPLTASPIGYDTAGSVLYFQRIVSGQVLEHAYGATPKPLMTLVEGVLYVLGGWRAISLAAVGVCALVITLATELVRRVAGRLPAVFAYTALLGSQPLVLDEARAYAVAWACLFLLIAAFALQARPRSYLMAGIALMAAVLTRLEVIVVVVGAVGCVAIWTGLVPAVQRRRGALAGLEPAPRRAWLLSIGLLAIPLMMAHDWILIRDPLLWSHVSTTYSAQHLSAVLPPAALVKQMAAHYLAMPLLVVMAVLGWVFLIRRRQYALTIGLALLGPGVALLLVLLAARHIYVSFRYLYLVDLALTVTAACGLALVEVPEAARALRSRYRPAVVVAVLAGAALVGMAVAPPFAPLDAATRLDVAVQRTAGQNLAAADGEIRAAVAARATAANSPVLLAPGLWTPRLIVDLGLRIADVKAPEFNAAGTDYASPLHVGELIYHDRRADPVNAVASVLERGAPAILGGSRLELVAAESVAGWWLYRVTGPA